LDKFQQDFVAKTGRPIKYLHDVKEVADEYQKYKELKTAITEVEKKIKEIVGKKKASDKLV
jgi:DNA polymerase II large subunit